jgi:hypothetical protein
LKTKDEAGVAREYFWVKGPMGMGLSLDLNGQNFVFVAGTGILVFLDLVAKLVLQNCQADGFAKKSSAYDQ